MDALIQIYLEAICSLAFGKDLMKSKTHATYDKTLDDIKEKYEPRLTNAVAKFCRATNERLKKKKFVFLVKHFDELKKSDSSNDVKETLRQIIETSLAGSLSDDLLDEIEPMIDELSKLFSSSYEAKINFKMVNQRAIDFLQETTRNSFSTLSDTSAQGIYSTISDILSAKDGYTLSDITEAVDTVIRSAFGDKMYFPTKTLDVDDYAKLVGRTESSSASIASTRAIADSLGLQTYQFVANSNCCDICAELDNQIMSWDDGELPPIHPNCNCNAILVRDEIDALSDDNSSDDTEDQ